MPEADRWLTDYGASHREIASPAFYWPAALVLVVGMAGMLWSLPVPGEFLQISPLLNWGSTFLMAAVVYYFIISVPLAIGMLPFMLALTALAHWLELSRLSLAAVSLGLTAAGLAGLVAGRRDRGGLPAVLHDIQLMMIAPLWLLSRAYRRLGIPY